MMLINESSIATSLQKSGHVSSDGGELLEV